MHRDVGDGDQLVCGRKVRYAALADLSEVLMRLSSCSSQKDNGIELSVGALMLLVAFGDSLKLELFVQVESANELPRSALIMDG